MNPREVYERNPVDNGREAECKLRPHEWDLYLRLDGLRTLQEISVVCRLDLQWIVSDVERLQQLELVRVVELDLEEYQQRFVKSRETTSVAPAIVPIPAPAPAPVPAEKPADPTEGKRVSFSLRRSDSAGFRPAAPVAPTVPTRPTASVRLTEEHHLKPLLDFITSHSGGGTVGQLAAYRVFLKVPNDLLRQAGIKSLNLVSEDFVVRDSHLWRVLLNAVEEVLGKNYVPPAAHGAELVAA